MRALRQKSRRARTARRGVALGCIAAFGIACGEDAVGPANGAAAIVPSSSVSLRGLAGEALTDLVQVQVRDAQGRPVAGARVEFAPVTGGGSATAILAQTAPDGLATARWRLGGATGTQRLRARVAGSGIELVVEASALDRTEADVLVVHGALGPLMGALVALDTPSPGGRIQERVTSDTVVHLNPMEGVATEVIVFSRHNRPLRRTVQWTAARDTAHVTLLPPVEVRLEFIVHVGNFDAQKAVITGHLTGMEQIWRNSALGLRLGSITYTNAIGANPSFPVNSATLCLGRTPGSAIQSYYITEIDGGRYDGWGCPTGHTFMSQRSAVYPFLLAHELGHTFGLPHTETGMMYPNNPGTAVTEGEAFRAHFRSFSTLNTIFGAQPAATYCLVAVCVPELYRLGSLTGAGGATLAQSAPDPRGALPSGRMLDAWPITQR
jgi:hypothetical protein